MENTAFSSIEAIKTQKELANKVIMENQFDNISFIAGVDISHEAFKPYEPLFAAVVVFSFPELEIIERKSYSEVVSIPYIPGLLAFREAPVIIRALDKINCRPDIILVDGQGIAHPRKLGIASHIGVLTGYPTIGCAKSILVGKPESLLPLQKGSFVPLVWHKDIIGNVLRTKNNVNPVYVSLGHKITLEKATEVVLACTTKYRIPEPLRFAHNYANQVRKENIRE